MNNEVPLLMSNNEIYLARSNLGLEVLSGHVWLTHLGVDKDTILGRGERAEVDAARGGLIQALGDVEVLVLRKGRPRK